MTSLFSFQYIYILKFSFQHLNFSIFYIKFQMFQLSLKKTSSRNFAWPQQAKSALSRWPVYIVVSSVFPPLPTHCNLSPSLICIIYWYLILDLTSQIFHLCICVIQKKNGTDELFAKEKWRHRCREQNYGQTPTGKGGIG